MAVLFPAIGALYLLAVLLLCLGLSRASYRFKAALSAVTDADPAEAVVVAAARNEAENLPGFLSAADRLHYPSGALEVVVVDDGSEDGSADILADFAPEHHAYRPLRLEARPEHGSPKKEALRLGIESSDHPLILLTDADTRPPAEWAYTMALALTGGCPVVAGHSPSQPRKGLLGWIAGTWELGSSALAGAFIGLGYPLHVIGRNWGFHRDLFRDAAGYQGLESALSGDDALLAQKLAAHSQVSRWGFTFAASTQVPTRPPRGWRHFLRQRRRHAATGRRFRPLPLTVAFGGFGVFALLWLGLVTLPWGLWHPGATWAVLLKMAGDSLFLLVAGRMAGELRLAAGAPLFSLLHLLLFPVLQLTGAIIPVRWKGRTGR